MATRVTDYGIKAILYRALDAFDGSKGLAQLAKFMPSDLPAGQVENYAWLGTTPSFREWIKERLIHAPQAFNLQIANKKFENTGGLPMDLINNDKTAQVQQWLASFSGAYGLWIIELIAAAINAASTVNAFDGVPFFSASHSYGKTGTFSNLVSSAASANANAVTPLEAATAINLAIETMKTFPDDQGRIIKNEMMSKIAVVVKAGTANAAAIRVALANATLSSGSGMVDNPLKGQSNVEIEFISSGLITTANTKVSIFRLPSDGGLPAIFQENQNDRQSSVLMDPNSEYVIKNDAAMVGLKTVGNVGLVLPSDAILLTFV